MGPSDSPLCKILTTKLRTMDQYNAVVVVPQVECMECYSSFDKPNDAKFPICGSDDLVPINPHA